MYECQRCGKGIDEEVPMKMWMFDKICYYHVYCWGCEHRLQQFAARLLADDDSDIDTQPAASAASARLMTQCSKSADALLCTPPKRQRTSGDYQPKANDDQPDTSDDPAASARPRLTRAAPEALPVDPACQRIRECIEHMST